MRFLSSDSKEADVDNAKKMYFAQLRKLVKHIELHEEFSPTGMGPETNNLAWADFDSKAALPRMWEGAERSEFDVLPFSNFPDRTSKKAGACAVPTFRIRQVLPTTSYGAASG